MDNEYDVIVIGGGFAGITAARDLRETGHSVLVLEARDRLGGRTLYREFADTTQRVEFGGTFVAPDDGQLDVGREIDRYGLRLVSSPDSKNFLWHTDGQVRGGWPVPPEQVTDLERAYFHMIRASHEVEFGVPLDQQDVAHLDVSVIDFFAPLELPRATLDFFTALTGLNTGALASDTSALHLLEWVAGFDNSPYAIYGSISEKFEHGTKSLVDAMVDDARAEVSLSSPVQAVVQSDDGIVVNTRDGRAHAARVGVIAVPLTVLRDIDFAPGLSEAKLTASAEGNSGRSTKVWVLIEGVPQTLTAVGEGGPLVWLSTEYELDGAHLMMSFGNKHDSFDITDPTEVQRAVEHLAPGARVLKFDAHDWNRDEFSKGTWMTWRPGRAMRCATAVKQREGRLVFAGSDTSSRWPGWIDGAIETGGRAAAEAHELLAAASATAER